MPYQESVREVLASAKLSIADKIRVTNYFQACGIAVDNNLNFISFLKPEKVCIESLVKNISLLPALKVPTQRILKKRGIWFDMLDE